MKSTCLHLHRYNTPPIHKNSWREQSTTLGEGATFITATHTHDTHTYTMSSLSSIAQNGPSTPNPEMTITGNHQADANSTHATQHGNNGTQTFIKEYQVARTETYAIFALDMSPNMAQNARDAADYTLAELNGHDGLYKVCQTQIDHATVPGAAIHF